VRFQVLTAASMKIRAFWNVAPCSLLGVCRRFRGASIIRAMIVLMMEAVRTSEPSVYSNETTRRYIPEGSHLCFKYVSESSCIKYWIPGRVTRSPFSVSLPLADLPRNPSQYGSVANGGACSTIETPLTRVLREKLIRVLTSQEPPSLLQNQKVRYNIHKNLPPVPVLSRILPVHTMLLDVLMINLNIVLPSTPRCYEWSLPLLGPKAHKHNRLIMLPYIWIITFWGSSGKTNNSQLHGSKNSLNLTRSSFTLKCNSYLSPPFSNILNLNIFKVFISCLYIMMFVVQCSKDTWAYSLSVLSAGYVPTG
jgi:hypothetical protein